MHLVNPDFFEIQVRSYLAQNWAEILQDKSQSVVIIFLQAPVLVSGIVADKLIGMCDFRLSEKMITEDCSVKKILNAAPHNKNRVIVAAQQLKENRTILAALLHQYKSHPLFEKELFGPISSYIDNSKRLG